MKAAIKTQVVKGQVNYTKRIMVKAGEKGTGRQLWACQYWPDSERSVEAMEEMLFQWRQRNPDVQVVNY